MGIPWALQTRFTNSSAIACNWERTCDLQFERQHINISIQRIAVGEVHVPLCRLCLTLEVALAFELFDQSIRCLYLAFSRQIQRERSGNAQHFSACCRHAERRDGDFELMYDCWVRKG